MPVDIICVLDISGSMSMEAAGGARCDGGSTDGPNCWREDPGRSVVVFRGFGLDGFGWKIKVGYMGISKKRVAGLVHWVS